MKRRGMLSFARPGCVAPFKGRWEKRLACLVGIFLCFQVGSWGQEKIHEDVLVVNQEVVARVLEKGRPVGGFQKSDFKLWENDREVEINAFWEVRHRMGKLREEGSDGAVVRPGRLFVLVFWLYEPEVRWAEALDSFFRQIWRPGDRVVLAFGQEQIEIVAPEQRDAALADFATRFNAYLRGEQNQRERLFSELEQLADDFQDTVEGVESILKRGEPSESGLERLRSLFRGFRADYFSKIEEFRREYLRTDEGQLGGFSSSLRGIDAEKWVILFTQHEAPPLIRKEGKLLDVSELLARDPVTLKELGEMFAEAERRVTLPAAQSPYIQSLRAEMIAARATFHLLLLDSKRKGGEYSLFVSREYATSNWESTFREICRDTGGAVLDGNRLGRAVEEVAAREDIHYVLTYAPALPNGGERRLRLEVARPGTKVVFARRVAAKAPFPLAITAVRVNDPVLEVDLAGYRRTFADDLLAGRVSLTVRAVDRGSEISRWSRELVLPEERSTIACRFARPRTEAFQLEIEVRDQATGRTATATREIAAVPGTLRDLPPAPPAPLPSPLLLDVLDKAAAYCERMQGAAFRFFCREAVSESRWEREAGTRQARQVTDRWLYDYQLVGERGRIDERRTLLQHNSRSTREEGAVLRTRFVPRYGVFLPNTYLAVAGRCRFVFREEGSERIRRRKCLVLTVEPKEPGGQAGGARLWVDQASGAVLKIELSPRAILGLDELRATAARVGADLVVSDVHWFLEERGGLWFPSETEFRESYLFGHVATTQDMRVDWGQYGGGRSRAGMGVPTVTRERREVPIARVHIEYSDYRYFDVHTATEARARQ